MAVDSAYSNRLRSLKFVDILTFGFPISGPDDVDLLTSSRSSNLVRIIARRVGNLPTNFGVSGFLPVKRTT